MNSFMGSVVVSIVGKTNAGKSTLLNALIGEKVSIVSPKKQTTRENILGILNEKDYQIVFVDTPGIHKTTNELGKSMMKSVRSAMHDVDVVVYIVDATKGLDKNEFENISNKAKELNIILVLSKIDIAGFEKTYPLIDKFSKISELKMILPISSKENKNLDLLIEKIKEFLVKQEVKDLTYSRETYTTQTIKDMAEEIIREKALYLLEEEVPHGIFVEIVNFKENKDITKIDAEIICKKNSHKAIIIGKQGNKLKEIATQSRLEIQELIDSKVMLTLYVKSREKKD